MRHQRGLIAIYVAMIPLSCWLTAAEPAVLRGAAALPVTRELPNPFVFADGSQVRTPEDWQRRRGELKSLFENFEYGHLPPKPEKMTVQRGDAVKDPASGVTREVWTLDMEHGGKTLAVDVTLTLPKDADGPVPVVVQGAFGGRGRPPGPNVIVDERLCVGGSQFHAGR